MGYKRADKNIGGWMPANGVKGWVPDTLSPPPVLDADTLWVLLSGMLGIAGLRSFDKLKGTQTPQMGGKK